MRWGAPVGNANSYHGGQETLLEYFFRHRILRDREDKCPGLLWMEGAADFTERMAGESGEDLRLIQRFVVNSGLAPEAVLVQYSDEFCSRLVALEQVISPAPGKPTRRVESL